MSSQATEIQGSFNPLRVIVPVLLMLLAISFATRWYARDVTLPRYCENPQQTLMILEQLLTEDRPAGDETRRPYIIAAKLLFLIPQKSGEPVSGYLVRIERHLQSQCHY